jgi:hypothetical protein
MNLFWNGGNLNNHLFSVFSSNLNPTLVTHNLKNIFTLVIYEPGAVIIIWLWQRRVHPSMEVLLKRTLYGWPPCINSFRLWILKISFFTKQATLIRRSIVLSLSPQFLFPDQPNILLCEQGKSLPWILSLLVALGFLVFASRGCRPVHHP